jgi:hypothetical protein
MPIGITDKLAKLVYERDSYHCARCGKPAPAYKRQLHHRKPRGMGGRNNNSVDFPENIVLLCGSSSTDPQSCHYQIESYRNMALTEGWLCKEDEDPREKLILARDGEWHRLIDDQWDPMLLPVTSKIPRPKRWSRGPERNARNPQWLAVHGDEK